MSGGIQTTYRIRTQMSVTKDSLGLKLVNDQTSPAQQYHYGTDINGVKGWHQNFVIWDTGNIWTPYATTLPAKTISASENIIFGINSAYNLISGKRNTVFGAGSNLYYLTTGEYNVAIGYNNSAAPVCNPYATVAIGAFNDGTTGVSSFNTLIGYGNLFGGNGTAQLNVCIGGSNMSQKSGNNNVCVGYNNYQFAGPGNGSFNYLIGQDNANSLTSGSNNWVLGKNNLPDLVSGGANVAIGFNCGVSLVSGSGNFMIGQNVYSNSAIRTNSAYIGTDVEGSADNQCIIGGRAATQMIDFVLGGGPTSATTNDNGQKTFTWRIPERYQPISGLPDQDAHNLVIAASRGIGYAVNSIQGGNIVFQTQDAGPNGTALNALSNRFEIHGATGDLLGNMYPNTRDDSTGTVPETMQNVLATDASGRFLSFPSSGDVYAPSISGDGTNSLINANYIRIANMVIVTCRFESDQSANVGTNCNVTVDVPILSNFAAADDIIGSTSFVTSDLSTLCDNSYISWVSGGRANVRFGNVQAGWAGNETITVTFMYKILP